MDDNLDAPQGDDPKKTGTTDPTAANPKAADHDLTTMNADDLAAELAKTRKALKAANAEAAANRQARKRLVELEEVEEQRKAAQLSDEEQLKRQLALAKSRLEELEKLAADANAKLAQERVNREIEKSAQRQGCESPELLPRLVDHSLIETDPETGRLVGVDDAVKKVLKDYPVLQGGRIPSGGGTPVRDGHPIRRPVAGDQAPYGAVNPQQVARESLQTRNRYDL